MKKTLLLLLIILSPVLVYSQITKSDEVFRNVSVYAGKVAFIKEIQTPSANLDANFSTLRGWSKVNFDQDPFNSSVSYDTKNKRISARSRIELLLPENKSGIREKIIMKYKFEAFFVDNLCIVEITSINYLNDAKANKNTLKQKIKAEDMITYEAVSIQDVNKETRSNVKDNTLYFFNDLIGSLQKAFNK